MEGNQEEYIDPLETTTKKNPTKETMEGKNK